MRDRRKTISITRFESLLENFAKRINKIYNYFFLKKTTNAVVSICPVFNFFTDNHHDLCMCLHCYVMILKIMIFIGPKRKKKKKKNNGI